MKNVQDWNLSKLKIIELYEKSQLKLHKKTVQQKKKFPLGTIKLSEVVVLNKDM